MIVVIVLACIFALSSFLFPRFNRTIGYGISQPIWILRDKTLAGLHSIGSFFSSKSSLIKENAELKDQNMSLQLQTQDYQNILNENQELKGMAGGSKERILARILSKPPYSPFDTLVIQAGSAEGIAPGNKIYLSDTIVIGVVTDVTIHTSLVTLFSSSDQKITGEDVRTGVSYEIVGRGGSNLSITVPKEADILWGDTIVYPGISPEVIGTVYYIDTNSQTSFKTAYLRVPANISTSKWVFVGKNQ